MLTSFMLLLILAALSMILLVLVQRGRGGGLAGALGGMGGQSAFGAKAGDTFTRITMWASAAWILLCVGTVLAVNAGGESDQLGNQPAGMNAPRTVAPASPDGSTPASPTTPAPGGEDDAGS